jgi:hypothetical protein
VHFSFWTFLKYFSPYSRFYSVLFSFSSFFSSLAIKQVFKCPFIIFHIF